MRVLINVMGNVSGGGETYYRNLIRGLGRVASEYRFFLLVSPWQRGLLGELPSNFQRLVVGPAKRHLAWRLLYEQTGLLRLLRRYEIDLLFSPGDMTTLLAPVPVVLTVQNPNPYAGLSPLRPASWRFLLLKAVTYLSARKARQVVFVSDFSRRQAATQLRLPLAKTNVVYHGIDPAFGRPNFPSATIEAFSHRWGNAPYILSVSTINPHKNYERLIAAFVQLCRQPDFRHHLVVAGAVSDRQLMMRLEEMLAATRLGNRVHFLGRVDHHVLPALYAEADLVVLASLLETFGLTVLEAMACNAPLVVSNQTAIPEVAGDAVCYFDPYDVDEIAAAIRQVLGDPAVRRGLVQRGQHRVAEFTWDECARRTVAVFDRAALQERVA